MPTRASLGNAAQSVLDACNALSTANALYSKLTYDTLNDFAPVIPLGNSPTVLVVPPSKGIKTVAELIAAAKAKPGAMNFASAGLGSTSHLAAERFQFRQRLVEVHAALPVEPRSIR